MSIKSEPFGGVTLTGEDAATFLRQVAGERQNPAAETSLRRGRVLAHEIAMFGRARIILRPALYPAQQTGESE